MINIRILVDLCLAQLQSIRRWERDAREDLAYFISFKSHSCQILAVAGAVIEAVRCLREGGTEPSRLIPFVEPYLPFYDSIRDEPEFIELLAEID